MYRIHLIDGRCVNVNADSMGVSCIIDTNIANLTMKLDDDMVFYAPLANIISIQLICVDEKTANLLDGNTHKACLGDKKCEPSY